MLQCIFCLWFYIFLLFQLFKFNQTIWETFFFIFSIFWSSFYDSLQNLFRILLINEVFLVNIYKFVQEHEKIVYIERKKVPNWLLFCIQINGKLINFQFVETNFSFLFYSDSEFLNLIDLNIFQIFQFFQIFRILDPPPGCSRKYAKIWWKCRSWYLLGTEQLRHRSTCL